MYKPSLKTAGQFALAEYNTFHNYVIPSPSSPICLGKFIYYHSLKGKTICYRYGTLFVFINTGPSWQNYMCMHPENMKSLHMYYTYIVNFPKHISFTMHFLWMRHGQILCSWKSHSLGKYPVMPGLGERSVLREDFCSGSTHIRLGIWGSQRKGSFVAFLWPLNERKPENLLGFCPFKHQVISWSFSKFSWRTWRNVLKWWWWRLF